MYDSDFFKMLEKFREDYYKLADWIVANFEFDSLVDLGCGSGFIIERLIKKHNKTCKGFDVSTDGVEVVNERTGSTVAYEYDLTKDAYIPLSDIAVCIEVAEHIETEHSDRLVQNIVKTKADEVIFTAAIPGQKGRNHINCQPHSFWIDKFKKKSYRLNPDKTDKLKNELKVNHANWLINNMMIFSYES